MAKKGEEFTIIYPQYTTPAVILSLLYEDIDAARNWIKESNQIPTQPDVRARWELILDNPNNVIFELLAIGVLKEIQKQKEWEQDRHSSVIGKLEDQAQRIIERIKNLPKEEDHV